MESNWYELVQEYKKGYEHGRADKYQEIISEYMLLTEKQVAEIRADMLDKIIQAENNKYYCDEELCGERNDCSECMVKYLVQLKRKVKKGKK